MMKRARTFVTGFVVGAVLFAGIPAVAADITATLSSQKVSINGNMTSIQAYKIDGQSYVKLKDLEGPLNLTVSETAEAITMAPKVQQLIPGTQIPMATDERAKVGDKILLPDGTYMEVKSTVRYPNHSPGPLPTATCDWTQFPVLQLPEKEIVSIRNEYGHTVRIRNLYETQRMQLTLYNAVGNNPESWQNGELKLRYDGTPLFVLNLTVDKSIDAHPFWPFRENMLVDYFNSCPFGEFSIEAWDVFYDGVFAYTEYDIR